LAPGKFTISISKFLHLIEQDQACFRLAKVVPGTSKYVGKLNSASRCECRHSRIFSKGKGAVGSAESSLTVGQYG